MLRPAPNEPITEFLKRLSIAMDTFDRLSLHNSIDEDWPRMYSCRFIEPGLVSYAEEGMVLVQKPVLDKMAQSFVGKPLINEVHKDVNPEMYNTGEADGVVTRVWYNENDGWYWCDFIAWDDATRRNCESSAYSVSCAYKVTNSDEKAGEYHNIPYHQEVLDGSYTHLAVVSNPRYEGARIVYNSKGGTMKMFNWFKKGGAKSASDMEKAATDVDGEKVTIKKMIEVINSVEPKKFPETIENMSDDNIIEVDGEEMPLKNWKEKYRSALKQIKNAEDEADKKKKEDEEKKNAEDADKKAKEDEEKKNAEDEADKKKKDDEEKKNQKHFDDLKNAADRRGDPQKPILKSRREMAEEGKKLYGPIAK